MRGGDEQFGETALGVVALHGDDDHNSTSELVMTEFDQAVDRLRRALDTMAANAESAERAGLAGDARRWRMVRQDVAVALEALAGDTAELCGSWLVTVTVRRPLGSRTGLVPPK